MLYRKLLFYNQMLSIEKHVKFPTMISSVTCYLHNFYYIKIVLYNKNPKFPKKYPNPSRFSTVLKKY